MNVHPSTDLTDIHLLPSPQFTYQHFQFDAFKDVPCGVNVNLLPHLKHKHPILRADNFHTQAPRCTNL